MNSLAAPLAFLLGLSSLSQEKADEPLEIIPAGMTRCAEYLPCVRLSITNNGDLPVSFGADGFLKPTIRQPDVEYFSSTNGNWTEFGQVVGTFLAPRRTITIQPGDTNRLYADISDIPSGANAVRVSIRDKSGTFHYSHAFDLKGRAVSAQ